MMRILCLCVCLLSSSLGDLVFAQAPVRNTASAKMIASGPMLGYVELREVLLWVQTTQEAKVQFEYWPTERPNDKKKSELTKTLAESAFTAKAILKQLEPGTNYTYQVRINGKKATLPYPTTFKTQTLWQWRTDPPAFNIATGSCNYVNEEPYDRPGKPYGSEHQIFTSIYNQHPELMLWLGDNTYLREVDWATRDGIMHRYTHDRGLPELQPLLASTAHYAIWDDHDYGPNDSDGTYVHKEDALDVFKMFWGNPTYGVAGQPSCATQFTYVDVDFFLLDNRYYRSPNNCTTCADKTQLGSTQREWLLQSLAASRAPFKIVALGGQLLSSNAAHEAYNHYHKAERDSILARIEREGIKNVVFLNGDRHFSELSMMTNAKGNVLYELTSSPLTSGAYADAAVKEANEYRVPDTVIGKHNFAMLRFSGPRKDRVMEIVMYDTEGKEIWKKLIQSQK